MQYLDQITGLPRLSDSASTDGSEQAAAAPRRDRPEDQAPSASTVPPARPLGRGPLALQGPGAAGGITGRQPTWCG